MIQLFDYICPKCKCRFHCEGVEGLNISQSCPSCNCSLIKVGTQVQINYAISGVMQDGFYGSLQEIGLDYIKVSGVNFKIVELLAIKNYE
jgi:hypothetical protein